MPLSSWISGISETGVLGCGLETKERGSGTSLSTGNPSPCSLCSLNSVPPPGGALGAERGVGAGRAGESGEFHGELSRFKVRTEKGGGEQPRKTSWWQ